MTSETEQAFNSNAIGHRLIYNGTENITIDLNHESISMEKIKVLGTGTGTIKYTNGTVALGVSDTVTDYTSQTSLFESVALGKVAPRSVVKFAPGAATASENQSIIPGAYVVDGSSLKFAKVVQDAETGNSVLAPVVPIYQATPTDGMDLLVSTKIGNDNVNRILNSITSEQDYVNNQSLTISSGMMTLQTANHWVQGGGTITSGNLNADGEYDLYLCALGSGNDMRVDKSTIIDNPGYVDGETTMPAGKLNLIKTGSGTIAITRATSANTYTGKTVVLEGKLQIGESIRSTEFYIASGAQLDFASQSYNGKDDFGDLTFTATKLSGNGTVQVGNIAGKTTLILQDVVYEGSKLTEVNVAGKALTLNNSDFRVQTVNNSSVINLNNNSTLTADTLNNSSVINLNQSTLSVGKLKSAADSTVKFDATSNLNAVAIETAAGSLTLDIPAGRTETITLSITGAGGVTKAGDGTMVLTSKMSYTGETLISEGVLQLNNTVKDIRFSGPVTIAAGATLKCNAHDSIGYNSDAKVYNIYGTLDNLVQNESLRNTTLNLYGGTISSTGNDSGKLDILNKDNTSTEDKIFAYALEGATAANPTVSTISSKINLRTNGTLEINTAANSQLKITGVISQGSANDSCTITKLGAGTLTLSANNTYTNGAIVKAGTLELTVKGDTGAFPKGSPITVDGATAVLAGNGDILGYNTQNIQGAIGSLTLQNGGTFKNDTDGTLFTVNSGSHISVNNPVYMNSGIITSEGNSTDGKYTFIFDNAIHVTGGENNIISANGIRIRALDYTTFVNNDFAGLIDVAGGAKLTISSVIDSNSTAALTKAGAGELALTGKSPYKKDITVNGGVLDLTNGAVYTGTYISDANVYVNEGGTLKVNNFGYSEAGNSSLGGLTYSSNGSTNIHLHGGTIQIANSVDEAIARKIELQANGGTLDLAEGVELKLTNNIHGAGALTKAGAGTLELTYANTYAGGTTISQGEVNLSGAGALGTGAVAIAENAVLNLNHDGAARFDNSVSGSGKIYKNGNGVLKIYNPTEDAFAAESFVVNAGKLDFKGYFKGALEIGDGAVFSPGNSIGTLTIDGNEVDPQMSAFSLDSGSTLLMEVGYDENNVWTSDKLIVNGNVVIDPDSTIFLTLLEGTALPSGEPFTLDLLSGSGATEDTLAAFESVLSVAPFFKDYRIELNGNTIQLTAAIDFNAVPEPSTWALLVLGVCGLLYLRKRK